MKENLCHLNTLRQGPPGTIIIMYKALLAGTCMSAKKLGTRLLGSGDKYYLMTDNVLALGHFVPLGLVRSSYICTYQL